MKTAALLPASITAVLTGELTPLVKVSHGAFVAATGSKSCEVFADNGAYISRRVVSYAYPRNGNVSNPTAAYTWDVFDVTGKRLLSEPTLTEAKKSAREYTGAMTFHKTAFAA